MFQATVYLSQQNILLSPAMRTVVVTITFNSTNIEMLEF